MDKLADWIPAAILLIAWLALVGNIRQEESEKEALYDECLTTDYDKFQCYAMIYGDK